jgi:hypothetical protein
VEARQLVDHYVACFEWAWEAAKRWNGEEV